MDEFLDSQSRFFEAVAARMKKERHLLVLWNSCFHGEKEYTYSFSRSWSRISLIV